MVVTRKRQATTIKRSINKHEKPPILKECRVILNKLPRRDKKIKETNKNCDKQPTKLQTNPSTRLRKRRTVNYLEKTLESPCLKTKLDKLEKVPVYKQHLNDEVNDIQDLYEFDSDSENVKKQKNKEPDDPSFIVNPRVHKYVFKKGKRKMGAKEQKNLQKENRHIKPQKVLKSNLESVNKNTNKKCNANTNIRIIRVKPNANSTIIKYDKVDDKLTDMHHIETTNLSIIGRRPNANSTMIEKNHNTPKRQLTEHVIIEDEMDNDSIDSDHDNSEIELYSIPQIEENESIHFALRERRPNTNSTMINHNLKENNSLKKQVQLTMHDVNTNHTKRSLRKVDHQDKENISPNVKVKKKLKKASKGNGSILDFVKIIPPNKKTDLKSQQQKENAEKEDDDDDDGWFNFECFNAEKNYANSNNRQRNPNILTPWRFNEINIKHNPHFITVKQSALPSINQEMVLNHAVTDRMGDKKKILSDENDEDVVHYNDVKLFEDFATQSSDEEIEEIDEIYAKPVKKTKFKWKNFLNGDPPNKKIKDVRSKEEEQEAEKWAEAFNSMCKEVEEFPLEIE